jgi:hypothetical protein
MKKNISMAALLLFFALSSRGITIVQGPQVGNNDTSSITFSWFSDSASQSLVEYGPSTAALSSSVLDTHNVRWHVVKVPGLSPATRYYYRATSGNAVSRIFNARTFPHKGSAFCFGAFGDTHGGGGLKDNYGGYGGTPYLIRDSLDLAFNIGDVVGCNDVPESTAFAAALDYKKRSDSLEHYVPMYEVFGNHDATAGFKKVWADPDTAIYSFVLPKSPDLPSNYPKGLFYSFDVGTTHFVAMGRYFNITPNSYWLPPDAFAWVKNDLDSARKRGALQLIVLDHEPLIDMGSDVAWNFNLWRNSWYRPDAENIYTMFDTMGVELMLHGHDHFYCRSNLGPQINSSYAGIWDEKGSITQIVTGVVGSSRYGIISGWTADKYDSLNANYQQENGYVIFNVDFRQMTGRLRRTVGAVPGVISDSFTLRPDAPQTLAASAQNGKVTLTWQKVANRLSLHGVGGYYICRSPASYDNIRNTPYSQYVRIGQTNHPDSIRFTDNAPLTGVAYYVVSAFDTNDWHREGNYSNEASISGSGTENGISLVKSPQWSVNPNPFKSAVWISMSFDNAHQAKPVLKIFNVAGRLVAEVVSRDGSGYCWNTGTAGGGVYIASVILGSREYSKLLLLQK